MNARNGFDFKKTLLCLAIFILTLFSSSLWADSFLDPPASDKSMYYLTQIFGTIDAAVLGISGGPPLMGVLFKVFNNAVLILGSILLGFYVAVGIVNSSGTGKFLGERDNGLWKPVRMAAGVVLLLPKSTGYSWVQVGFMWIILQGIGAADKVWDAALYYFSQGGGVLAQQGGDVASQTYWYKYWNTNKGATSTDPLSTYVTKALGDDAKAKLTQLLTNTVCVLTHSKSDHYTIDVYGASTISSTSSDGNFVSGLNFGPLDTNTDHKTSFGHGLCGYLAAMDIYATNADKSVNTNGLIAANIQMAFIEAIPLLQQIAPAFVDTKQTYYDADHKTVVNYNPSDMKPTDAVVKKTLTGIFINIGAAIQNGLVDYVSQTTNSLDNVKGTKLGDMALYTNYSDMRKDGWIFAGNYYNDLVGKGTNLASKLTTSVAGSLVMGAASTGTMTGYTDANGIVEAAYKAMNDSSSSTGSFSASASASGGTDSPILEAMGFSKLNEKIGGSGDLFPWIGSYDDPIAHLAYKGWSMMVAVEVILLVSPLALFLLGFFSGIGSPYNPAPTGIAAAINFASTLMIMILGTLYTEGVMLAKYVPLIPFMVYMSAALGWMMIVFEAMIAAPVVALGMMHHEGHDMYGKAEPAVMLILNVFLRPSLTVLGFIGAMLFTHVAIDMLNIVFNAAMTRTGTTVFSGGASIAIYTALVIGVMNKVFSLIHQVPDRVLRWVGDSSQGVGGAEEMMQGAKGATESFGRESTQPMGDFAKGSGQLAFMGGRKGSGEKGGNLSGEATKPAAGGGGGASGAATPPAAANPSAGGAGEQKT